MTYHDDYTEPLAASASLGGYFGESWASVLGVMIDGWVEGVSQAVLQRFVQSCSEDALPLHAADRLLFLLPGETAAQLRARLLQSWTINGALGTPTGVVTEVKRLGYSNTTLYENGDWQQAPSAGFAPGDEWWRFWVVIGQPHRFYAPWIVGDATVVGTSKAIGIQGAKTDIDALTRTVKQQRGAHNVAAIIVVLSGQLVGNGLWTVGDGTQVGAQTIQLTT